MLDKSKWMCLRWGRTYTKAGAAPSGGFFIANQSFPEVPTNREAWAVAFVTGTDSPGILFVGASGERYKHKGGSYGKEPRFCHMGR